MSRWLALPILLSIAPIGVGGCSADLLVGGDDPEGSTGTGDPSTSVAGDASNSDGSTTTGGAEAEGTSEPEGTSLDGPGETSTSTTEPGETTEGEVSTTASTETTATSEVTTTGEPVGCSELLYEACVDDPECAWFGPAEDGLCSLDPCLEEPGECLELGFEDCVAASGCAWFGDLATGECSTAECPGCELLEEPACNRDPNCTWNPRQMTCQPL